MSPNQFLNLIGASIFSVLLFMVPCLSWAESVEEAVVKFSNGAAQQYSTVGQPKAKEARFSIKFPQSWKAKDGAHSNVVQNFISDEGLGMEIAMILTKAIPDEVGDMGSVIKSTLTPAALSNDVPDGVHVIKAQTTEVENVPAGLLETTTIRERVGVRLNIHQQELVFFQGRTMVSVLFQVMGTNAEEVSQRFEKFRPLFFLMMNSIILDEKWK